MIPPSPSTQELVSLLLQALHRPIERERIVGEYSRLVLNAEALEHEDIHRDLADVLSYFEADPGKRAEDPSFFGHVRCTTKICSALDRLRAAGVKVEDEEQAIGEQIWAVPCQAIL